MLCEECGKNDAVVVIKQTNSEGQVKESYLCENCASKTQSQPSEIFVDTYADFTLQLLSLLQNKQQLSNEAHTCPHCGLAFSEFIETNRLGCEQCYSAFRENLLPYISQVQNSYRQHVGKKPNVADKQNEINKQVDLLKIKLQEAVEKEAFEDAAIIRDRIKELKGGSEE